MKFFIDKRGNQRWRTNKRDIPITQWTVQGQPMNNHQPRRGTRKMKNTRCNCEICTRNTKEAKEKLAQKEFKQEKTKY